MCQMKGRSWKSAQCCAKKAQPGAHRSGQLRVHLLDIVGGVGDDLLGPAACRLGELGQALLLLAKLLQS